MEKPDFVQIIRKHIENEEKLGDQAGGSGHLGFKSYELDVISEPEKVEQGWKVTYKYTIYVESEFEYDPDFPPPSYPHEVTIIVDESGNVTKLVDSSTD